MAAPPVPTRMMPSLIDRLTDAQSMGGGLAGYDFQRMVDSVRSDLEDLLNTRRTFDAAAIKPFPETAKSIAAYGLPDLNLYNGTSRENVTELGRVVAAIIQRHEPRLRNVRVRMVVGKEHGSVAVRYHIDAELNVDPSPEIGFETVLELSSGKATVQAAGGSS
jgi:type VI secretion system protein ImpF